MNNNGESFDEVEDDDECLEGSAAATAQKDHGKANRSMDRNLLRWRS